MSHSLPSDLMTTVAYLEAKEKGRSRNPMYFLRRLVVSNNRTLTEEWREHHMARLNTKLQIQHTNVQSTYQVYIWTPAA